MEHSVKINFHTRDLCLRALDTNSLCTKGVRRNEDGNEFRAELERDHRKVIW